MKKIKEPKELTKREREVFGIGFDIGYVKGRDDMIKILRNEVIQGIKDGFLGIKYNVLLELCNVLEKANKRYLRKELK